MKNLAILISTMNHNAFYLSSKLQGFNRSIHFFICHQITDNQLLNDPDRNHFESYNTNITLFKRYEKGLSKSRNCVLDSVKAEVCLFADDDVIHKKNIDDIILNAFRSYPNADIITFQTETPEGEKFKNYPDTVYWHNKRTLLKVSSIEIAIKKNNIEKHSIRFDETFGLGSTYPTGEEIIFLMDAYKKGLKILYLPVPIVIHPKEHSGANYSPVLLAAKGAMFVRLFGLPLGTMMNIFFAFKKFSEYKTQMSLIQAIYTLVSSGFKFKKSKS